MKLRRKAELVFWMVTLGALPAWANNPPQPDGVFSLILIFPVVIFGFRLAGVAYTEKERKWRVLRGLLLGLAVIVSFGGTELAMIPLVLLLIFGCMRGVQIIIRGQGPKRLLIGTAIGLWTLFAVSDYGVSLTVWSPVRVNEQLTVEHLRSLATAEQTYARTHSTYATIEQMRDAGIPLQSVWGGIQDSPRAYDIYLNGSVISGYRYGSTLDPSGKRLLITAIPAEYEKGVTPRVVPGASWLYRLRPHAKGHDLGQRSFALDESGVIRAADLGTTRPVSREEAEKWKPLQ